MKLATLGLVFALGGCASGVARLDVATVIENCARWCANAYPSCSAEPVELTKKPGEPVTCHDKYAACVQSCPPK